MGLRLEVPELPFWSTPSLVEQGEQVLWYLVVGLFPLVTDIPRVLDISNRKAGNLIQGLVVGILHGQLHLSRWLDWEVGSSSVEPLLAELTHSMDLQSICYRAL